MMMAMSKGAFLFSIIPTTLLLMLSFFVLVVLRKIEERGLRIFGSVIVALLWLGALVTFSSEMYLAAKGKCPLLYKKHSIVGHGAMKGGMCKEAKPSSAVEQQTQGTVK